MALFLSCFVNFCSDIEFVNRSKLAEIEAFNAIKKPSLDDVEKKKHQEWFAWHSNEKRLQEFSAFQRISRKGQLQWRKRALELIQSSRRVPI